MLRFALPLLRAGLRPAPSTRLVFASRMGFATPSGKKYLNPHDVNMRSYVELGNALGGAYTSKMFAELLKDNIQILTDYQLSYALYRIWNHNLELDEHFTNVIVPIIKEFVKNMDRECNRTLAEIIQYIGWLKVQDDALWTLFEQKVVTEKLYRYITLENLVKCAHAAAIAGRGSKDFFQVIEGQIIKHRLSLNGDDIEIAQDAFTRKQLGSSLLYEVLADPKKEISKVKQLEAGSESAGGRAALEAGKQIDK